MRSLATAATIVIALAAVAALVVAPRQEPAIASRIDTEIDSLMADIQTRAFANPAIAMSSNPYDYVQGSSDYARIVSHGYEALPVLSDMVGSSPENGLREYILAVAAEDIARVDLKANGPGWASGKEWRGVWKAHLRTLPTRVHKIALSEGSAEGKAVEIEKLGIVAAPYVLDEIAAGHTDLGTGLVRLVQGNPELAIPAAQRIDREWVASNASRFSRLRAAAMAK